MYDNGMIDGSQLPLGLGMAFAQNLHAMNYFSNLSKEEQEEIINQTHEIRSKEEMKKFVSGLGEGTKG